MTEKNKIATKKKGRGCQKQAFWRQK